MVDKIVVTLDEYDAVNDPIKWGSVYITPSTRIPGLIGKAPYEVKFTSSIPPQVSLYPNDLIGPLQSNGNPGNSYQVSYSDDFPGHPLPWSFYLLSTNGPNQKLSDLATIPLAQSGSRNVPLPAGASPSAGQIWVADGGGNTGHWQNQTGLALVATTGVNGFALQNATPDILTWTAPADGQLHRYLLMGMTSVTAQETGGQVTLKAGQIGGGNVPWSDMNSGDNAAQQSPFNSMGLIDPGSTITLSQITALSAGAAKVWAEIWGV